MLAGSPLLLMRCALSRCVVDTQLMTATFPLCMDFVRMCSMSTTTVLSMLGLACSCYCLAVWPIESVHMCVGLSMPYELKMSLQVSTDMVDAYFKRLRPDEELHLEESAQHLQSRL